MDNNNNNNTATATAANNSNNNNSATIIPTVDLITKWFNEFNKYFFRSTLRKPKIKIQSLNKQEDVNNGNCIFSQYIPDFYIFRGKVTNVIGPGTIIISNDFKRLPKAIQGTLLHEMVHHYIGTIEKVWPGPKEQHGTLFNNVIKAFNIDKADFQLIEELSEDKDEREKQKNQWNKEYEEGQNSATDSYLCIIEKKPQNKENNYNFWIFRTDSKNKKGCEESCNKITGAELGIYECPSVAFLKMPINPSYLTGFGGMTIDDVAKKVCEYCSTPLIKYGNGFELKLQNSENNITN